jgi:hypothetical protein
MSQRLGISAGCGEIAAAPSMSGIKHSTLAQCPPDYMPGRIPPAFNLIMTVDQEVRCQRQPANGGLKPTDFPQATALRAKRLGFNHQQIDIRVVAGLVTSSRPEKDDLLWMRSRDKQVVARSPVRFHDLS